VGALPTSSLTGSPSETRATNPDPLRWMLKRPLARIPAVPPFTRVTSHSIALSNARMFSPLTVIDSSLRRSTCTSIAW
jgi:hypothetical protein